MIETPGRMTMTVINPNKRTEEIMAESEAIAELQSKVRHLKLRAYEVYERSLPEGKGPRNPNERNDMMRRFMRELDHKLLSCERCCK